MSNIPITEAAVYQAMAKKTVHPTKRVYRKLPGCRGRQGGLRIKTPAWSYFLTKHPDGWELHPPNTSTNYAKLVDQLIEVLLEAQAP